MPRLVSLAAAVLLFLAAPAARPEDRPEVVATAGDATVTSAELRDALGTLFEFQIENEVYERKVQKLNELIDQRLEKAEAAARNTTIEELEKGEVEAKAAPVSDADVNTFYERVKARQPGKTEEELKALIRADLVKRNEQVRRRAFVQELRAKAHPRILLDPPRLAVSAEGGPSKGPKDAPVTMVEYSDFQCPYCGRVAPVVKRLEDTYGDKLRFVFRYYPLPMHPDAPKAAEAAACAADQSKFWEMHDRLFAHQDKLQVADLKAAAAEVGLDPQAFAECLDSGKHAETWKADQKQGESYGVEATPWFFINGRELSGAQPYENFAQVIDDELQRSEKERPKTN